MDSDTFRIASTQHSAEELLAELETTRIPEYMHQGLVGYLTRGIPVGDFLTAVLSNNLRDACHYADSTNKFLLFDYVDFLYNFAPRVCWGNELRVRDWLRQASLDRMNRHTV